MHWMFEKEEEQWMAGQERWRMKKKSEGRRKAKQRKKLQQGGKTRKSSLLCLSSKSKIEFLTFEMLVS